MEKIQAKNAGFTWKKDISKLIDAMFGSARTLHGNCSTVLLTDSKSTFSELDEKICIKRFPTQSDAVIFNRLEAQLQFLESLESNQHVVFLDTDMLFVKSFDSVFQQEFDIGLTFRDFDSMPINGGLILINSRGIQSGIRFLKSVKDIFESRYADEKFWWGDQHALMDVVGMENFQNRVTDRLTTNDSDLLLLPCEEFNFSPHNTLGSLHGLHKSKWLLHFKGKRKWQMAIYADACLELAPPNPTMNPALKLTWKSLIAICAVAEAPFKFLLTCLRYIKNSKH